MKDNNHIVIDGWMINHFDDLNLTEIVVYAVIFGLSQKAGCAYYGSINYLAEATKKDKGTIIRILARLQNKGYIEKIPTEPGKPNKYIAKCDWLQNATGCKMPYPILQNKTSDLQNAMGELQNAIPTSCKMPHNNIINNKDYNKDYNNDDNITPTTQKNEDYKLNFESVDIKKLAESMRKEIAEGSESVNAMMSTYRYDKATLNEKLSDFVMLLTMRDDTKKTRRDFRHHFLNFLNTQKRNDYDNEQKRLQRQQYESPAQQNPRLAVPDLGEGNCKLTDEELEEARKIWNEVMEAERKREEQEREKRSK